MGDFKERGQLEEKGKKEIIIQKEKENNPAVMCFVVSKMSF